MERKMLGISLKDRKTNLWIRQQTRVKDILAESKRVKWRWAGHVIKLREDGQKGQLLCCKEMAKENEKGSMDNGKMN